MSVDIKPVESITIRREHEIHSSHESRKPLTLDVY